LFSGREQLSHLRTEPAAAPVRTPTFSSFFGFFLDLPQATEPPYDGPVRQTLGSPGRHSPIFFTKSGDGTTIDSLLVCILVVDTSDNHLPSFILVVGTCDNHTTTQHLAHGTLRAPPTSAFDGGFEQLDGFDGWHLYGHLDGSERSGSRLFRRGG